MEQMNNFGFNLKLCNFKTWCAKIATMGETKSAPGHNPVRKMLEAVATSKCVLTEICDFFVILLANVFTATSFCSLTKQRLTPRTCKNDSKIPLTQNFRRS